MPIFFIWPDRVLQAYQQFEGNSIWDAGCRDLLTVWICI